MPTDQKTIDAYNKFAEKWANAKRDRSSIFHRYLEKPGMYGKLPDLVGKDVLCIGCGSGEEGEFLRSLGAKRVVGIDISEGLIDIARKTYPP
jgi:2-polyprenyl-3-methyl-5-hydroxy-6-metoxy-1,4-benzoquinol methylase